MAPKIKYVTPWCRVTERSYTKEEIEFMLAMHAEKERLGRMPTYKEMLRVARKMGYSKNENDFILPASPCAAAEDGLPRQVVSDAGR